MSTSKSLRPILFALLLVAPLIGCATSKPDEKITANVQTAIDQHPDLGPPGVIQVQTRKGVVYLSGQVNNGLAAENVVSVTRGVSGVSDVVSNISVAR
jgi:osmotically-inducible protein OsmY